MDFEATIINENNTIVNVTNFGVNMTNDRLRRMFEKYGTISSYGIMNDNEGWHRFAYIAFDDSDAADEAVIELNGQKIDDERRIRVRRTRKRQKSNRPTAWSGIGVKNNNVAGASSVENPPKDRDEIGFTVYVENLEISIDRLQLRKAFESYGMIIEARIIMDREGSVARSKGYGFVTFARAEDAQRAIREKSGRLIGTQIVRVEMARGKNRNLGDFSVLRNFKDFGLNDRERGRTTMFRPREGLRSCSLTSRFGGMRQENQRRPRISEADTMELVRSFLGNQDETLPRGERNDPLKERSSSPESC